MRIKKIQIKNFKSLVDFELENLKPFCAFVGPNASGKSNIFEALEFTNYVVRYSTEAANLFGGLNSIYSFNPIEIKEPEISNQSFEFYFNDGVYINFFLKFSEILSGVEKVASIGSISKARQNQPSIFEARNLNERDLYIQNLIRKGIKYENDYEIFIDNFQRIFIGNNSLNRIAQLNSKLFPDASNVSEIIGNIFKKMHNKENFIEWLRILIPEFENIEIKQSNIDGSFEFFVYEKSSNKPFPKHLLSDGTKNILSLMAAVYQNNQPQFLCIEEPENGLHPQAIQLLVDFFREKCEEHGHHIWLNTHSQTLVRCLNIDEIVLVNKVDGQTRAKQVTDLDDININTDEAWLSNALGGGVL